MNEKPPQSDLPPLSTLGPVSTLAPSSSSYTYQPTPEQNKQIEAGYNGQGNSYQVHPPNTIASNNYTTPSHTNQVPPTMANPYPSTAPPAVFQEPGLSGPVTNEKIAPRGIVIERYPNVVYPLNSTRPSTAKVVYNPSASVNTECSDPIIQIDNDELWRYFRTEIEKENFVLTVTIHGSHPEKYQDTRTDPETNIVETYESHRYVPDFGIVFDFSLSMRNPCWSRIKLNPDITTKEQKTFEQVFDAYTQANIPIKRLDVVLYRHPGGVGWDERAMTEQLKAMVPDYKGELNCSFNYSTSLHMVALDNDTFSQVMRSDMCGFMLAITCLWIVWVAIESTYSTDQFVAMTAEYDVGMSQAQFIDRYKAIILDVVRTQKKAERITL